MPAKVNWKVLSRTRRKMGGQFRLQKTRPGGSVPDRLPPQTIIYLEVGGTARRTCPKFSGLEPHGRGGFRARERGVVSFSYRQSEKLTAAGAAADYDSTLRLSVAYSGFTFR
jgi:hypothetical protein